MVTTSAVVLTPARGMQVLFEGYRFVDLVLWIWIWSSVSEEIFTRAWFQTLAGQSTDARIVEASSALLFGLMHLSLLAYGVDPLTVLIIVVATTVLGFLAARFRTVTRSIYPSITTHVSFNVGSAVAGIVLTILSLATDGAIPRP